MPLAPDVDLAVLAAHCAGFSGADVMALCREAALAALAADLGAGAVAARDFEAALATIVPSFGG